MTQSHWARVQQLFDAALRVDSASRLAWLDAECGDDTALLAEVKALLHADASSGDRLDRAVAAAGRVANAAGIFSGIGVGAKVGRYRIDELLGRGAMGVVYRATDTTLGRDVALKFLPAHLGDNPKTKARFVQEARAASALDHPNICTVYEIDEAPTGAPYIAMAFCSGQSLAQRLSDARPQWRDALRIAAQLASALASAHQKGVVHRDLKPANVIIDGQLARIVDFGIAKVSGVDLTEQGTTLGTPAYMSPEQLRGGTIDGRSDIWALGVLLYEMLCGKRPFTGSDPRSILNSMKIAPRPLPDYDLSMPAVAASALQAVLDLCLTVDKERRYPSMQELLRDLDHLGAGVGPRMENPIAPAATGTGTSIDEPSGQMRRMTVLDCVFTSDDSELLLNELSSLKQLCARVVAHFEGIITEPGGETVRAWFGYPRAHEDDTRRATRAGLQIIREVGLLDTRRPAAVNIRAAVHSGLMIVKPTGGIVTLDPAGMVGTVARDAASIVSFAADSELLVNQQTRELLGSNFHFQPAGERKLDSERAPEPLFRVNREQIPRTRQGLRAIPDLTPLFGREHELAMLSSRWDEASGGRGQCILLSGEAGIGKSRLIQSLAEYALDRPETWLTQIQCSAYQRNTALHPVIELLTETALDFTADESPSDRLSRIDSFLTDLGQDVATTGPLIASLLGLPIGNRYPPLQLSAERQRQKTLELLTRLLLARADQQPLLLIVEDLHWADPTFIELLGHIADQIPAAPILAVLTFRPEFDASAISRDHIAHVSLPRLTDQQTRDMVVTIAAGKLRESEITRVTSHTDGVPLFVEELTKSVVEASDANDRGENPPTLNVPATLQESLTARLDRLGPAKTTAQRASTLGREFSFHLLKSIDPRTDDQIRSELANLVSAGLLFQRGHGEDAAYIFKHALIQEAAYGSLLPRDRQRHHDRIADALIHQFKERCDREPELPARHLTAAQRHTEAIRWWILAGRQAQRRSANREAVAHFSAALDLLDAIKDGQTRNALELEARTALGPALMALGGYTAPDVEQTYRRALVLAREQGATPAIVPVLFGLWTYYVVRADFGTAKELGEQLLRLGGSVEGDDLLLEACTTLGVTLFHTGEIEAARDYLRQGIEIYDRQRHGGHAYIYGQDPGMACRTYLAAV